MHRDAAARIDYGFYTEDLGLVRAARDSLAHGDAWSAYFRAYASYREASLVLLRGTGADAALAACIEDAEDAAQDRDLLVEAHVLVAACAALAAQRSPLRAGSHKRRHERALATARAREPGNPRLRLIEHVARGRNQPGPALETVLAAFRGESRRGERPSWGEADVLVMLAVEQLDAGAVRAARDYVERALLIAPEYRRALELERHILSEAYRSDR